MDYLWDLFLESGVLVLQLFGLSMAFAYILTFTSRHIKRDVIYMFGYKSQVYFGFLGIMIHELGHLIAALIFRHRIDNVKLLKLPNEHTDDNSLGSVSHSYNKFNLFHRIGNFFIGIAPIFSCTISILGLYLLLFNDSVSLLVENIKVFWVEQDFQLFLESVLNSLSSVDYTFLKTSLFIIVVVNIAIGGFDLSRSDFEAIYSGLLPIFIASLLITFIVDIFFKGLVIGSIITGINVTLGIVLGISLVVSIITLIVTKLMLLVSNRLRTV